MQLSSDLGIFTSVDIWVAKQFLLAHAGYSIGVCEQRKLLMLAVQERLMLVVGFLIVDNKKLFLHDICWFITTLHTAASLPFLFLFGRKCCLYKLGTSMCISDITPRCI